MQSALDRVNECVKEYESTLAQYKQTCEDLQEAQTDDAYELYSGNEVLLYKKLHSQMLSVYEATATIQHLLKD